MPEREMEPETCADAHLGYPAWRGFVKWALNEPAMQDQFTRATGIKLPNATAVGFKKLFGEPIDEQPMEKFILWVTKAHYGLEYAPPKVAEAIAADPEFAELLNRPTGA